VIALTVNYFNDIMLAMNQQQPPQSDPALMALHSQLVQTLRTTLPPPMGRTPEDIARRNAAAVALATSLAPANAAEAALTVKHVVAGALGDHAVWLAQRQVPGGTVAKRLAAQHAEFVREAQHTRSLLLAAQLERHQRENADRAARRLSPQHGERQDAGTGPAIPGSAAEASPAQPPSPPQQRHAPPTLRLIQGGLAS
jgi:hypothetical protein